MQIPSAALDREAFYADVVQRCLISRESRRAEYDRLRSYFLFGCNTDHEPAKYNKIYPALDLLTAFLFAADTTRFAIQLGAGAPQGESLKVPVLMQRVNDKWQDSNADNVFGLSVLWALVFNTMIVKLVQRGQETHPYLIEPHNFGILREEQPMLDRQEAMVHVFWTTRPQLERDLDDHPNKTSILSRLSSRPRTDSQLPAGVQRIITSSFYPTMQGNLNAPLTVQDFYRPQTQEELVEMHELWLWDTDAGDYRVVTLTDPQICIYDRLASAGMFLKGEHPFTQVCPNPAPDYFWGHSEVARLTALQDEREHHMAQIRELVDRNVNSPKAMTGIWGDVAEKSLAMEKLNALISTTEPMAKIQEFKPELPHDMWATINAIDNMFDEATSLNNLARGQGDTGVRSKGQTESLLRVGTTRPKKRALIIEDSLERIATQYLKLDQKHDPNPLCYYVGPTKNEFTSAQFTDDYMVKVDGHSSSPVFMEDQKNEAKFMLESGIIDGESYLDLTQPQGVQLLKERYRVLAAQRAAQAAEQQAIEQAKAQGKVTSIKG